MIKYLGSKRTLLPVLRTLALEVDGARSVLDVFSGTARVGHALKAVGLRVAANDHNAYAATLARCYVAADRERVEADARRLLDELARLAPVDGWFTETFCRRSRFFQEKNGRRVDAMREQIARWSLAPELEAVLLVALMEAADRVDSTVGVQMAYLKQWAQRAHNDLELRLPEVLPASPHGPCSAHQLDAVDAAALEGDVVYLDPPYNQHSYLGNYHVWESLVRWDKPDVYGVACKRVDVQTRKSLFNRRNDCGEALERVVDAAVHAHPRRALLVSFSDEGYLDRDTLEGMLGAHGEVHVLSCDYRRYVGAKIGIYNPQGERVGAVSHTKNVEHVYVVDTIGTAATRACWRRCITSLQAPQPPPAAETVAARSPRRAARAARAPRRAAAPPVR